MRASKHVRVAENGHAPQPKGLADLTLLELKAHCYDMMAQIQQCQNNLKLLNDEIARRVTSQPDTLSAPAP